MSLVDDKHWNDLAQLGKKLNSLSQLLDRAKSYGATKEALRFDSEIAHIHEARDEIIRTIAELSVAA